MFRKALLTITIILILIPVTLRAWPSKCEFKDTVDVFGWPEDMTLGQNTRTFTSDTLYVLVGHCVVEDGQTIYVQPGTVFWGAPTGYSSLHTNYDSDPGAIIVARGGYAEIVGNASNPVVMTMYGDDVCDPYDKAINIRGQWGGLIICGYARNNSAGGGKSAVGQIEGIEDRFYGLYGCEEGVNCDDSDNSGIYQYLSVRHGGHQISDANEINGITMGAVGYGTTIDHCEVFANLDDGYEWFGGTVGCKYLIAAYGGDDCFDYDEGYRGLNQFWLACYTTDTGDKNGEHDGGTVPEDDEPYAIPIILNATYIGGGPDMAAGKNSGIFAMRDNNGGQYINSVFTMGSADFIQQLEDVGADPTKDSEWMLRQGNIAFYDNLIMGMANYDGTIASVITNGGPGEAQEYVTDYFNGSIGYHGTTNRFLTDGKDVHLENYWWTDWDAAGERLDPRYVDDLGNEVINPAPDYTFTQCPPFCEPWWPPDYDPQLTDTDPASYFEVVGYRGAFGPAAEGNLSALWARSWSHLYERGIFPYICGDVNYDDNVNILDIVALINTIYKGGSGYFPIQSGDTNNDGNTNILDIVNIINYKYKAGADLTCP